MQHLRFLSIYLCVLLFSLGLQATNCIPNCDFNTDWTMEVRGAYYYLPGKAVKKIYSDEWLDYQVEIAKRVHPFVEVWGGVSWASKHGHMHERAGYYNYRFKNSTSMTIVPLNIGLKAIYPILPYVDVYAGLGACYSFLRIKNFCKENYAYHGLSDSPFKKAIYKNQFGGVFKLGLQYAMSMSTYLDFFADYYTQNFEISHRKDRRDVFKRKVDCSGFKLGIGFGVYF